MHHDRGMPRLEALEAGRIETIHAAQLWRCIRQMAGQGAEIAVRRQEPAAVTDFCSRYRTAAQPRIAREEVGHDGLAFLWLERTGAIDKEAAGLHHFYSTSEEQSLQGCKLCEVALALEPRNVGMSTDGPGGRAWGVKQHGVERAGLPLRRIGDDGFGCKLEARQILPQPGEAGLGAIDRNHAGSRLRELRGLAAGRRAEISDHLVAHVAQEACRQSGSGVLHPPGTVRKPREQRDRTMRDGVTGSG